MYRTRNVGQSLRKAALSSQSLGGRWISSGPCTRYLEVTHPEDTDALPASLLAQLEHIDKHTVNTYSRPPLIFTHGHKSKIYTSNPTREYLDFSAGIAVNALGHSDEGFQAVLAEQVGKLTHASNVYWNEWSGEVSSLLVKLTKREGGLGLEPNPRLFIGGRVSGPGAQEWSESLVAEDTLEGASGAKVFLSNSGTEANEGALKFARKYGKELWAKQNPGSNWADSPKTRFLCFENSFHGRSMGSLSATTNPKYQAPFAPLIPGFDVGKVNSEEALEMITDDHCGVIIEPIQGEGGIFEADQGWLRKLRQRCTEKGVVLIYDEIQCGLYRTGTLWAHSAYPVDCHPDILTMAKALGNGYPVGGIMVRDEIAKTITVGSHGTTSGGNVLAARVAHYVLSRLSTPSFQSHLAIVTGVLDARLSALPKYFPTLLNPPRGRGAIRALSFKDTSHPGLLLKMARERGVLLLTAGKDAVRLVPSLNIDIEDVQHAMDVIESALVVLEKETK